MKLLLRSMAGSHLYGLSHDASDTDYFDVVDSFSSLEEPPHHTKAIQTIKDGLDVTMVTLSQFIYRAQLGSHQALDAMFSESTLVDEITELRHGFHVGYDVIPTYNRTITKFINQDRSKKFKHAMRLAYNLHDAVETGRFDPKLSPERVEHVLKVAQLTKEDVISEVHKVSSYIDLDSYHEA